MLHQVINKVLEACTKPEVEEEVKEAKEEFIARTGKIYEEDSSFETRMSLFLEWFVFDRKLQNEGMTPLEKLLQNPNSGFSEEEMAIVKVLPENQHSIFEFSKVKEHVIHVIDYADNKKKQIQERRKNFGLVKKDIFEARIISFEEKFYFSGPMLFHPGGAKKFIKSLFIPKDRNVDEIIFRLSQMSLKLERYRHISFKKIYCKVEDAQTK